MTQVYINRFLDNNKIIRGVAVLDKTIAEDMSIIFNREQIFKLLELKELNPPDGFYSFTRFCQFVIYINYRPNIGFSLEITDYKNDVDAALDIYSELRGKDWEKSDRDKIMKIFLEIENVQERAEMVIKDPF